MSSRWHHTTVRKISRYFCLQNFLYWNHFKDGILFFFNSFFLSKDRNVIWCLILCMQRNDFRKLCQKNLPLGKNTLKMRCRALKDTYAVHTWRCNPTAPSHTWLSSVISSHWVAEEVSALALSIQCLLELGRRTSVLLQHKCLMQANFFSLPGSRWWAFRQLLQ